MNGIDRLFILRILSGQGFRSLVDECGSQVLSTYMYLTAAGDPLLQEVWRAFRDISNGGQRLTICSEGPKVLGAMGIEGI